VSFAQFDSHEIMVLELALRRTLGITGVLQELDELCDQIVGDLVDDCARPL
jgi:hypothetical protein